MLDRLSIALGGRTVIPLFFPIVSKLLQNDEEWKHHFCAALSISIIAEGIAKKLYPHLLDVLKYVWS